MFVAHLYFPDHVASISLCILGRFLIDMGWKTKGVVHRNQVKQTCLEADHLLVDVVMEEHSSHDSSIDIKPNYQVWKIRQLGFVDCNL